MNIRKRLMQLWLVIRHRPIIKCPICDGEGGAMSGYYEPEWSECPCCYKHWVNAVDWGVTWAEGRLPLWSFVRAKVAMWCRMDFRETVLNCLKCKAGWHLWERQLDGETFCERCYARKDGE